ncbi:MAG TPA: SRPBCC family protein [Candidatus Limnocylindrales bacterium]|nr:SRPBCC family protein [Candidatus Limnocylindrales bacterium]
MGDVTRSIEIPAPPNEVFVFFVPQRMPLWYGTEMDAHFEVQGGASEFASGQKIRISGRLARYEVQLTVVITAYEWERLLEWRFQDSYGVKGIQRWELQHVAGKTRVVMRDVYEMPSRFGKILDRFFTVRGIRARDQDWLTRLQRLAAPNAASL